MNELYAMNPACQYLYLELLFGSLTLGIVGAKIGWGNLVEIIKKVVDNF